MKALLATVVLAACGRMPTREMPKLAPPPDLIPAVYTVGLVGDGGVDADPTSLPPLPDASVPVDVLVPFEPEPDPDDPGDPIEARR